MLESHDFRLAEGKMLYPERVSKRRGQTLDTQKSRRVFETMRWVTFSNHVFFAGYLLLALLLARPFQASAQSKCGPKAGNEKCTGNLCCNANSGWCGDDSDHCNAEGCDPNYGKCGPEFVVPANDFGKCGADHGTCGEGMCCSDSNYCGSDKDYCSLDLGCRRAYGKCWSTGGTSTIRIVGIALGTVVAFVVVGMMVAALWVYLHRKTAKRYTYKKLSAATDKFSEANKLGGGTFGTVYKGTLHGKMVAVKKLKKKTASSAQIKDFESEIQTRTARLNHKNLMEVIGFCVKGNERFLVYDYMQNGSLNDWLFQDPSSELQRIDGFQPLQWSQRFNIVKGVAEGLIYLHHSLGGNIKSIVHGDIKPDNILLGQRLEPKLADFGMAKLIINSETDAMEEGELAALPGTEVYRAPKASESSNNGNLQHKADVFSFGIVLLEIVSGRRVYDKSGGNLKYYLPLLAIQYFSSEPEDLSILLDPKLDLLHSERLQVSRVLRVALWCLQYEPKDRPNMNVVLDLLKGNTIDDSHYQNPPRDLERMRIIFEARARDLFPGGESHYRIIRSSSTSGMSHRSNSQSLLFSNSGPELLSTAILVTEVRSISGNLRTRQLLQVSSRTLNRSQIK